jgi:UDP-glucose 4-epimerase
LQAVFPANSNSQARRLDHDQAIMFKSKTLLITGGTGGFGNAVLRRFLKTDIQQIRIFSRDEKKQDDMRHEYKDNRVKFYIGDVRNLDSLREG